MLTISNQKPYNGPNLILLAGTSTAGKSTTADNIKSSIRADYWNCEIEIISYDDFCQRYGHEFEDYLNELLISQGFEGGLKSLCKGQLNEQDTKVATAIVEEQGTQWMHQKMAGTIQPLLTEGKTIIVDTLDTNDMIERVRKLGYQGESINTLLYVPIEQFPQRVKKRNDQALEKYQANHEQYKNIRDAADVIEQYQLFYTFDETPDCSDIASMTGEQIQSIFEQAQQGTIELFEQFLVITEGHLEQARETNDEALISKLEERIGEYQNELTEIRENLEASKSSFMNLLKVRPDSTIYHIRPSKPYDVVVDAHLCSPSEVSYTITRCATSPYGIDTSKVLQESEHLLDMINHGFTYQKRLR